MLQQKSIFNFLCFETQKAKWFAFLQGQSQNYLSQLEENETHKREG